MEQTDPPTVPISALFPGDNYPEGEILSYKDEYVKTYCITF